MVGPDGYYKASYQLSCPSGILPKTNGSTLEKAKEECNVDKNCKGVLDGSCDQTNYFLCINLASDYPSAKGCVHEKS